MSNNGQSKLVFVVQLILTTIVLFQIVFLLRKNTIKNKPTAPYWWLKSLANPWNFSGIIGVILCGVAMPEPFPEPFNMAHVSAVLNYANTSKCQRF